MTGYTVLDFETTGLSPERGGRVVEIGVVYVSDQGDVQDHWSTLINPERDIGPRSGPGRHASSEAIKRSGIKLEVSDRIVFTGDMTRDRGEWEGLARLRGLNPGGVTKKTKLVVAADPNSLSGKAAKARTYGVPIITEAASDHLFAEMPNA